MQLARAAHTGDEIALAALHRAGTALGQAIASASALLDVDHVVVGGGFAQSGPPLWNPLRAALKKHAGLQYLRGRACSNLGSDTAPTLFGPRGGVPATEHLSVPVEPTVRDRSTAPLGNGCDGDSYPCQNDRHDPHPRAAAPRRERMECPESVHRLGGCADLTDKGVAEGKRAGELLAEHGILPDIVYTSLLRRAISTANIALDAATALDPGGPRLALNERHYGELQGKNKAQIRDEYGDEQFMLWRRSYDTPPPPIDQANEYSQEGDPRYSGIDVPKTECLLDVVDRMIPYWESTISGELRAGKTVLVAAHGNSLRALVKHLDRISDDDIAGLNIPTGIPLRYELDENLRPVRPCEYLDPEAAAAGAAAVAGQGGNNHVISVPKRSGTDVERRCLPVSRGSTERSARPGCAEYPGPGVGSSRTADVR